LDFDDVVAARDGSVALRAGDVHVDPATCAAIAARASSGWLVFAHAWRPQIARGEMTMSELDACFARTRELLGIDVHLAFCSHDAGPPICWCRKPLPGRLLEFALRRGVALGASLVVARSAADKTMAGRLGIECVDSAEFFA
jgi:hypothetical protein